MTQEISLARKIHAQAWQENENGNFETALEIGQKALNAYLKTQDIFGIADMCCQMSLFYRTWVSVEPAKTELKIMALGYAQTAVDLNLTLGENENLGRSYYTLSKCYSDLGRYQLSQESVVKAISLAEADPTSKYSHPAIILDMKTHLGCLEYLAGDESAIGRVDQFAKDILAQSDYPQYELAVWASGAYLNLALRIFEKTKDKTKAQFYLNQAKEIIDQNPKLSVRKKQFENLVNLII